MMEEILKLALDLGKQIAKQERYIRLREAEDSASVDKETGEALESYERQRRKVAQLEADKKPVEPEDKRELQRLSDAVHSNPVLQNLAQAQADYMELMSRVNQAIRRELDVPKRQGGSRQDTGSTS